MKRILYAQYTNPAAYPPLEHSSRILADAGWRVLMLGTGARSQANTFSFPAHPNISVRKLAFCHPGWRQKLHYAWFNIWMFLWVLFWRPTVLYASDHLACPGALLVRWLLRGRVIYHEHDTPELSRSRSDRFLAWCRRRLARKALLNIVPNERRAESFRHQMMTQRPVVRVWNCPSRHEVAHRAASLTVPPVRLFYHGSIVPARLPLTVIEALAAFTEAHLSFAGYETVGHPGYVDLLLKQARQLGVADRVTYLGAIPQRRELLNHCQAAHIGLALMPSHTSNFNELTMSGASNKPFDYMACGLTPLVSDLPDWRKMFVDPGYALACIPESPQSIVAAIAEFAADPAYRCKMADRVRAAIAGNWNYETQFKPVSERLASL